MGISKEEQIENLKLLAKAFRSKKYKQSFGSFRQGPVDASCFCAMGVIYDFLSKKYPNFFEWEIFGYFGDKTDPIYTFAYKLETGRITNIIASELFYNFFGHTFLIRYDILATLKNNLPKSLNCALSLASVGVNTQYFSIVTLNDAFKLPLSRFACIIERLIPKDA